MHMLPFEKVSRWFLRVVEWRWWWWWFFIFWWKFIFTRNSRPATPCFIFIFSKFESSNTAGCYRHLLFKAASYFFRHNWESLPICDSQDALCADDMTITVGLASRAPCCFAFATRSAYHITFSVVYDFDMLASSPPWRKTRRQNGRLPALRPLLIANTAWLHMFQVNIAW